MNPSLNEMVDDLLAPQQDCPTHHETVKAILRKYGYHHISDLSNKPVNEHIALGTYTPDGKTFLSR